MPMKKGVKGCRPLITEEMKKLEPAMLLSGAESYIEAVCSEAVYARDCGSLSRIEKLEKALHFAREVYHYLGVKTI
jgi:hypothetical protein